jgi:hypothetical protein
VRGLGGCLTGLLICVTQRRCRVLTRFFVTLTCGFDTSPIPPLGHFHLASLYLGLFHGNQSVIANKLGHPNLFMINGSEHHVRLIVST